MGESEVNKKAENVTLGELKKHCKGRECPDCQFKDLCPDLAYCYPEAWEFGKINIEIS